MSAPLISVVVITFNMARELPRTLLTLRASYQKNISNEDIEIIVVDNGSTQEAIIDKSWNNIRYFNYSNPTHSPVEAVNFGLSKCNAKFIGVMIDGARMASPNLLSLALMANKLSQNSLISTHAYHLGHEVQMKSVLNGYNQQVEDELLQSVPWETNGYSLFNISVFAGSSAKGWFNPIAESNAFFTTRVNWDKLGGFDERFKTPGGGLVNLDTYLRATELEGIELISLLGEGTFHQVHGGVATNQQRQDATWNVFHEEYRAIRGKDYSPTDKKALLFGKVRQEQKKFLVDSANNFID
ncbi:glycosyltransferase family A protein [Aliikangiella sp. G2MR2-5]|uniref:glycosyltransferase family 2 protein n=1 Tax=Aliikangiella sp. G2MR2-5 TaxID=2788943 RepID=UPI0018A93D95|nr:glycosyltransferase family A protein [Aliikangiella sp. G2MR2-5]